MPTSWNAPAETFHINVIGQIHLFEAIHSLGLDPVVQLACSSEEYGLVHKDETPITEQNPPRPLSPYAVSKVAQDFLGYQYFKSYGLRAVRTRGFNQRFSVPGLGLKRGLADNLVISPYATALAAMVSPVAAVRNFEHLAEMGARGRYGFYEAIDFTPERLQSGQQAEVVRCFMAHHQGMTITALANVLCNGVLRRRFHADPMIQASELLLQERMPRDIQAPPPLATVHHPAVGRVAQIEPTPHRRHANPWSASPATHLLSNGRYTVMLTAAGSGYSMWRGLASTRWREDATRDDWGSYFYVRDAEGGECLSPTLQPVCHRGHGHRAIFDEEKAEFSSQTKGLTRTLEVIVSEEDDAEVRRISIKNLGRPCCSPHL